MINALLPPLPNPSLPIEADKSRRAIDLLCGLALLGMLLVTIQAFGLTDAQTQQLISNPHGGNYWLLTGMNALAGTSMAGLLTLIFGAGLLLFLDKAQAVNSMAVPELLIRALMALLVFGLLDALGVLWTYDLLFSYAILGILMFPFRLVSAQTLLIMAIVLALVFSGKSYWSFAEQKQKYEKYQTVVALEKKYKAQEKKAKNDLKATAKTKAKAKTPKLTDEQQEDKSAWEGMVKGRQYDKKQDEATIKAMRSDYTTTWSHLLPTIQYRQATYLYQFGIWDFASMMLLGMALFKLGFFADRFTTAQYLGVAVAGIGISQAIYWFTLPAFELKITDFTKYISTNPIPPDTLFRSIGQMASAVGWASVVLVLYRANVFASLWRAIQTVGRMGFSNYLFQSMLGVWFFYGYGLGYFGQFKLYQLYFVVAEIWMLQLIFSAVWLRYYRLGPFEWLWECVMTGQWQPIRLHDAESTATPILSQIPS